MTREIRAKLDRWRNGLGWMRKGCGCVLSILIGLFSLAMIGGMMMGDYMGPPEGAAADQREKGVVMLVSLVVLVFCIVAGSWLASRPKD